VPQLVQTGDLEADGAAALHAALQHGFDLSGTLSSSSSLRRNLGPKLRNETVSVARRFLAELAPLEESLAGVTAAADRIDRGCQEATASLAAIEKEAFAYLSTEAKLRGELEQLHLRRTAIEKFLAEHRVSPEQVEALTRPIDGKDLGLSAVADPLSSSDGSRWAAQSAAELVGAFEELSRARAKCAGLFGTALHGPATELYDEMSRLVESALLHIFEIVRETCSVLAKGYVTGSRGSLALRGMMQILKSRPALYSACEEAVAMTRRRHIARSFVRSMLAQGADDSPRGRGESIGSILAWIHEAIVTETEAMSSLFALDDEDGPKTATAEDDQPKTLSPQEIVAVAMAGVAKPLEVRLDQAVSESRAGSPLACLQLHDVLAFYSQLFGSLLQGASETALPDAMRKAAESAASATVESARLKGTECAAEISALPSSLKAPLAAIQAADYASQLLAQASKSLADRSMEDSDTLAGELLRPVIDACKASASVLPPSERAVWMINSLGCIVDALKTAPGSAGFVDSCVGELHGWMELLVRDASQKLLSSSSIVLKLRIIESHSEDERLDGIEGMDATSVRSSLERLVELASSSVVATGRDLESARFKGQARDGVAAVLVSAYEAVSGAVSRGQLPPEALPLSLGEFRELFA
jgi:hypothetical protein